MSDLEKIILECDDEVQDYLRKYFVNSPSWIRDSLQVVKLPKGTTFIEEGRKADKVYIFIRGKVTAVDYRVCEMAYGFYEFYPVDAFGALEVLGELETYKTTLVTSEPSVFLKLSKAKYEKWIRNDINALLMQTKRMGEYLVEQARKERLNVLLKASDRIALVLIKMYEIYVEEGQSRIYISRKNFTEMTGLSERTITRILKEFEGKGKITRDGWDIVLNQEQYSELKELVDHKINVMGDE